MGSTMTTTDLDKLDWTMDYLGGAAQLLMGMDHTEPGFEYVLEKIRQDIEYIVDPVRQLISERYRAGGAGCDGNCERAPARRNRRRTKRKRQVVIGCA